MVYQFEAVALIVTVLLALVMRRRLRAPAFRAAQRGFRRFANRQWMAVLFAGLLSFGLNASIGFFKPITPRIHDEFSCLLAADTFYHGRLTNPTPPLWEHFETIHVILKPTYQSKYPPAYSMMLAFGRCIANTEVGNWLCLSLASAAICWMLQGWLRPHWALVGALLFTLHPGIVQWWGQTYYAAGGLSTCGGALIYGALRRLMKRPTLAMSATLGLGLFVLAQTRPFEGLAVALPAVVTVLYWSVTQREFRWTQITGRVIVPGLITAGIILACVGYYNWRVTENPLRFPYQVHETEYATAPLFLWEKERPAPTYRHASIHDFQMNWSVIVYRAQLANGALVKFWILKQLKLLLFYLRPILLVAVFAVPWILRDRWMRFAGLVLGCELMAIAGETFLNPHYIGPVVCIVFLLLTRSLQQLRACKFRGGPFGQVLFRGMMISIPIAIVLGAVTYVRAPLDPRDTSYAKAIERAEIVRRLKNEGGKHLVVVKYAKDHDFLFEWVYNEADIEHADIVWARPMSREKNQELLEHFADRKVWLLTADTNPSQLSEYKASEQKGESPTTSSPAARTSVPVDSTLPK